MRALHKALLELLVMPFLMLVYLGFAWIPMLAWNIGVVNAFGTEPINYWTAYWLAIGLSYLTVKVTTVKSNH